MHTILLYLQLEALERPEGLPLTYLDVHRRLSLSSRGNAPISGKFPPYRGLRSLAFGPFGPGLKPPIRGSARPDDRFAKAASGWPWRPHAHTASGEVGVWQGLSGKWRADVPVVGNGIERPKQGLERRLALHAIPFGRDGRPA